MFVQKCDLCQKEIKDPIVASAGRLSEKLDLCFDCGKPILQFLKKHKVIDAEAEKKIKAKNS